MNVNQLLKKAHASKITHGFINYWVAALSHTLEDFDSNLHYAEIGIQNLQFLELLYIQIPYNVATAVVLENDPMPSNSTNLPSTKIKISTFEQFNKQPSDIDIAYSFEIFSLIENINSFAQTIFNSLNSNGVYYATFAWHSNNPCTQIQIELRKDKNQNFYLYTLDDIVQAFHQAGFEVSIKKINMPYFLVVDPKIIYRRYGSLLNMLDSCYNHLFLFSFRKFKK
jgi:hypothetical protein